MYGGNPYATPYFGQGYSDNSATVFRLFRAVTAAVLGFARNTRRVA